VAGYRTRDYGHGAAALALDADVRPGRSDRFADRCLVRPDLPRGEGRPARGDIAACAGVQLRTCGVRQQLHDTRADVVARFEQELERLSPGQRQDVEQSLEVIRGAIDDINAALQQDPDNTLLQDLLMKTYHEELNVMRKVGGVTQSVMSRRDI
jgi:hypothetical protein